MLNAKNLGIAGGIVWGLCMFLCTILAIYTGYTTLFLEAMKSIYIGYSLTWPGAFIGLVYGFIDAFIGLFLLAWIYNKLNK